ncbi:MAG: YIP1 family protein [Candidatus Delongbacteria bacterium]
MNEEQAVIPENVPFEEQQKYGFFRSLILTLSGVLRTPGIFFNKMHINKGYKMPLMFLIIMLAIGNTFSYIYVSTGVNDSPAEQVAKAMDNEPELSQQAQMLRDMMSAEPAPSDIIFGIITNLFFIYLLALYWHVIMRSLSVAINGFQATFRVFCYSSALLLSAVLPFSSPWLNMLIYMWWMYIFYTGISEAHEVSGRLVLRGMIVSLFATMIPFIILTLALF